MSYDVTEALINRLPTESSLTPTQRAVLLIIAHRTNPNTKIAWPSQERIAEVLGLQPRSVRKAVRQLTEQGWLAKAPWYDTGNRPHKKYWMPWLSADSRGTGDAEVGK